MWELARGLRARGHEACIVARSTAAGLPSRSTVEGTPIRRYRDRLHTFGTLYLTSLVAARSALGAALREFRPDVVHAHHSLTGLGASGAGARSLCYTFYGPWHLEFLQEVLNRREMPVLKRWTRTLWAPAKASLARRLEQAAIARSGRLVALSAVSVRQLTEIHGVDAARITLIPGGVDLERFAPIADRGTAREALGLPRQAQVVFTVRRLVPRMGLEMLLDGMTKLPGVMLIVGGTGWLRPRLERMAAALGIAARVRFAGFIPEPDLPRYYGAADLVALPSVALEGFGLITLEALACGAPVVVTPDTGAVDVVGPLEAGWVADDISSQAVADVIARVLPHAGEPEVRERCRAHAEGYSWERMVARHEDLYRTLV
jgi:glycosyltransferase involved in cell wall biosynthesis